PSTRPPTPRSSVAPQLSTVYVGIDAARRRYRRRPDVLFHPGTSDKLPYAARSRTTFGRSRPHGSDLDHVPLRHPRLGHVRTHGCCTRTICIPLPPTTEYPIRFSPHLRKSYPRCHRQCCRYHRYLGHYLWYRNLTGHRCCLSQLRSLGTLRTPHKRCCAGCFNRFSG